MSTARVLAGLTLMLTLASNGQAQALREGVIVVDEVEALANAAPKGVYATNRLLRGERVEVVREDNGYVAIRPPNDAFSWIPARSVQVTPGTDQATVTADEAPVRIGSRVFRGAPYVEPRWARVAKGTRLTLLGKTEPIDGELWLSILPGPAEVRYIPAQAVRVSAASPALTSSAAPATAPTFHQPERTPVASNLPPNPQPVGSSNNGAVTSAYSTSQDSRNSVRLVPPVASAPAAPLGGMSMWSAPGRLYRAAFTIGGRPVYGLETTTGQVLLYTSAQQGLTLDPYVGRNLYIYGSICYRGDLRKNYMVAEQVYPLP